MTDAPRAAPQVAAQAAIESMKDAPRIAPEIVAAPRPDPKPSPANQDTILVAAATFNGDQLVACTQVSVNTVMPRHPSKQRERWFTLQQGALLVLGDAVGAFDRPASKSILGEQRSAAVTRVLAAGLHGGDATTLAPGASKKQVERMKSTLAKVKWPPADLAKMVSAGRLVRVPNCDQSALTSIGRCSLGDSSQPTGSEHPTDAELTEWVVVRHVSDSSEAAMKRCWQVGGAWSASGPTEQRSDATAAAQDTPALRAQAAPAPTALASLELRAAETQALHMRARAAREADSSCTAFDECVERIPPLAERALGELGRRVHDCEARKTQACRTLEVALERARMENIATQAELVAARKREQVAPSRSNR